MIDDMLSQQLQGGRVVSFRDSFADDVMRAITEGPTFEQSMASLQKFWVPLAVAMLAFAVLISFRSKESPSDLLMSYYNSSVYVTYGEIYEK